MSSIWITQSRWYVIIYDNGNPITNWGPYMFLTTQLNSVIRGVFNSTIMLWRIGLCVKGALCQTSVRIQHMERVLVSFRWQMINRRPIVVINDFLYDLGRFRFWPPRLIKYAHNGSKYVGIMSNPEIKFIARVMKWLRAEPLWSFLKLYDRDVKATFSLSSKSWCLGH